MVKITPAILPQTYRGIEMAVEKVLGAVPSVQIDIVDGHLVPNQRTWLFNNKNDETIEAILNEDMAMPYWQEMNYELDLMVKDPTQYMETFIALGPSKMIFHVEGLEEQKTIDFFENLPEIIRSVISFGIALSNDTDPAVLAPYMPYVESIQCMGIRNIGYQGQPYDERVIPQIKKVKQLYPDKAIAVDGDVNFEDAVALVEAGADELVVGSMVFQNPDPQGTIEALQQLCNNVTSQLEN